MSGGEQKQLEVGAALLLRPRVLLIDEPSIGCRRSSCRK
jgi:branched-chain amino acid transport system ATP-binding protein